MGLLKRFKSSLTYPIAATLVLVTVLPVALSGWLFASYNREHLTTVEKLYLNRQAVSLANEVDHFFSSRRTYLESTARALAVSSPDDVASFESFLEEMANEAGPSFAYLQILNREGEGSYVYDPLLKPQEVSLLSDLVRSAQEGSLLGEPAPAYSLELPASRSPWAILVFPLEARDGVAWGSLAGVLDFADFEARFSENTFSGFYVSVIDGGGKVVLCSTPSLRGASLAESPLIRDFLTHPLALTSTYTNPMNPDAGEVLGSAAPVSSLGWGVLLERSTSLAFAPVRVMQHRTLMVSAIAGLVALGLGFVLSRHLVRPLQDLAHISSEISEGKFSVRSEVHGDDEIAQLGSNFNHMAENIESLVRKLKHALRQNQELFLETIRTLAAAIDAKDPYTKGHSERVSAYSMAIARHLGLGFDDIFHIRIAAILHDVGKLGIKDGILNKPGGLTDEEYEIMRRHPAIGAQIMTPISKLKTIIPGIRNHHETWDGNGYPDKLAGEQIPMVARIIGVADTFDAMTTHRPYQKAMSLSYVTDKMKAMAGTRFDPEVVDAFSAAVDAGDIMPPEPSPEGTPRVNSGGLMNRRIIVIVSFLVLALMSGGTVVSLASPSPDPKKNKKQAKTDPLLAQSLIRQAYSFMQQQRYEEALESFRQAEEANPGNATIYNMMGLCYMSTDRIDQARELDTALRMIPGFTDARNNRGTAYLALEQYRLAEVDFIAVLSDSTYPHRWKVFYNLGLTYLGRGQVGAAEENFTKAITATVPVFEAYLRLAEIAVSQGRNDSALGLLEEAHFKFPERLDGILAYGRLLAHMGRMEEARPYLQDVVASDPGSQLAVEARALLANPLMPFNILLTNLMVDVPEAVGAIFLDDEGETVDFVTRHGEPFDLKVEGAVQGLFTRQLDSTVSNAGIGDLEYFVIEGTELATLTHVLPDGYYVVLVARKPVARARAQHHLRETAKMIARELE